MKFAPALPAPALAALALAALATALAAAPVAAAGSTSPGGFTGPNAVPLVTVADATALPNDAVARLQGHIIRSLGPEKYEFRDDTGTVTVEIDDEVWRGVEASPDVKVELLVEVDRDWRRMELEAESISLVP